MSTVAQSICSGPSSNRRAPNLVCRDRLASKVATYPHTPLDPAISARPAPALSQELLRNKKCTQIDRGAQSGSRTPLKMLSLLQCSSHCPAAKPPGSSSLGLHEVSPWRNKTLPPPS